MSEWTESEGGIVIPKPVEDPKESPKNELPIKEDWHYSRCSDRRFVEPNSQEVREALELLYIVCDGGRVVTQRSESGTPLIDQLAVLLIGGVPAGYEEYT